MCILTEMSLSAGGTAAKDNSTSPIHGRRTLMTSVQLDRPVPDGSEV